MLTDHTETQPKPVEQLTDKELDREVYSLVFGHPGIWNVPPYTANMVYGWRVVEKMRDRGCYWHMDYSSDQFGCCVGSAGYGLSVSVDGKQPARAVCEAAVGICRREFERVSGMGAEAPLGVLVIEGVAK